MAKKDEEKITHSSIVHLLESLSQAKIDFIKIENLFEFDGKVGYSLAQGE